MITDAQTNFVYFSELLRTNEKYSTFCQELISILKKHGINFGFLPCTNDIWCRDFMPVQVTDYVFIEYRYDPDYLQANKWRAIKTYPDLVCDTKGLKTIKTDLILDGGNVIKSSNRVILTDKVIKENRTKYSTDQLILAIKKLFEIQDVIIIPWDKENEEYGHADGMIRFINDNSVLLNGYFREYDQKFQDMLYNALDKHELKISEMKFEVSELNDELNWAYVNFLQMKDLIIVPQFGIEEDNQALQQIRIAFPSYSKDDKIKTIDASSIVQDGGALNCISWNIKR